MSVRTEDYDEVVAAINRKYEGDIKMGNEYENPARISTGSVELDTALTGGIPIGRWTRFYGGYHSCKTLTALQVIREAQKLGMYCAYYNIEKQYDPKFAKEKMGVNIDELTVVEGTTIEEIGDKVETAMKAIHLHVLDSCSIAVSEDELEADVRDWRPGITSRAWGKVFRRWQNHFSHTQNTIVMLDQVRTNFKTGAEGAAGGRIFDHMASVSVHFKKGNWLYRTPEGILDEKAKIQKGSSGQAEPAGQEVKVRVEKSRVGRPLMTATMRLDLDTKQFDRVFELLKIAKHYKIVETKAGGNYYYTPPGKKEAIHMRGEPALREFIAGDITLQEEIKTTAMEAVK